MPKRKVPPGPPAFFDEEAVSEFLRERGYDGTAVQRCYAIVCRAIRDLPLRDCDDAAAGIWETATDLAFNGAAGFPPAALAALRSHFVLFTTSVVATHESGDGCTTKSVVELRDSHHVEAVAMRHAKRSTVCVSSQVGCQMGCQFCATGTMGIIGDLTAAEIVEQFAYATLTERLAGRPAPKNVVFMGMGEPLQNYDAVRSAVEAFTKHFVLRKKAITVSTVGVVPNMRRLARDLPDVRLALSLHAPTQALREIIVPAARAWPLNDLMAALDDHLIVTKRIHDRTEAGLMIEYVLLGGVNDSDECADELADLLRGKNVMLNLIPYNPNVTAEMYGFVPPTEDRALAFGKRVVEKGLRVRVRREMGQDIAAACGQLALVQSKLSAATTPDIEDGPGRAAQRGATAGRRAGAPKPAAARGAEAAAREAEAEETTREAAPRAAAPASRLLPALSVAAVVVAALLTAVLLTEA